MRQVAVVGAGMTRFGKHQDRSMKDLAREAVEMRCVPQVSRKRRSKPRPLAMLSPALLLAKNVFVAKWSYGRWGLVGSRDQHRKCVCEFVNCVSFGVAVCGIGNV